MMNPGYHYNYGGTGMMLSGGGILLCALMAILMISLTVLSIILIVRLLTHKGPGMAGRSTPPFMKTGALDILNERLAKGEISAEEYQKIKLEILRP